MSLETKERMIKLLEEGKSPRNVGLQAAVSKIWTKYKQRGKVVKGKHAGRHQSVNTVNLKCLERRNCTAKQIQEQMKGNWNRHQ